MTGRELLVRKLPAYPGADPDVPLGLGLSFSPDGSRLAVVEPGGTILVFDESVPTERPPLKDGELDRLWADLASTDPKVGWAALIRLDDDPDSAVRFLAKRLTPVREPDAAARLIAALDAPSFRKREAAYKQLLELGDAARPSIAHALDASASGERRNRLELLSVSLGDDRSPQPVDLRRLRALTILRWAASKEARALIDGLAAGVPTARVTLEARAARERLARLDAWRRGD